MTWGDKSHGYSANSVIETQDSGYLIAGQKSPLSPMPGVAYLLRIDKQGKELWNKTFGDTTGRTYVRSSANASLQDSSGFVIAGEFGNFPPDPSDRDIFLMQSDLGGNLDLKVLNSLKPVAPTKTPENAVIRSIPANQAVRTMLLVDVFGSLETLGVPLEIKLI